MGAKNYAASFGMPFGPIKRDARILNHKNGPSSERKFRTLSVEWLNFETFGFSLGVPWRYFFISFQALWYSEAGRQDAS